MPVQPTYPGVYIQELPSGSHTITGVSTSVTAFVGRALRGPINTAITINSFADFQRTFGGLWKKSLLSYAVRDFFVNGGSQAIIIRVFNINEGDVYEGIALSPALRATAPASLGLDLAAKQAGPAGNNISCSVTNSNATAGTFDLTVAVSKSTQEVYIGLNLGNISSRLLQSNWILLMNVPTTIPDNTDFVDFTGGADATPATALFAAANPGIWGNQLQAQINNNVSAQVAEQYGLKIEDLFNLIVKDNNTGAFEQFNNLTVVPSPGQVDKILADQSKLIRIKVLPTTVPANGTYLFSAGNDGDNLNATTILGNSDEKSGLYALENINVFNLLCIPGYNTTDDVDENVLTTAASYCASRRAFYIIDAPSSWDSTDTAASEVTNLYNAVGSNASNAAVFFPRVKYPDPLNNNLQGTFTPCGMIAGMMAKIDNQRGVWKAPAGLETGLAGVTQLSVSLTDSDSGKLNPIAVNCLRTSSTAGTVIWGSRTLQGNDILASDWKYIPVRRMALYIEQSAYFGTQWAVFEPNAAPLWRQITLSLNGFMNGLFRQGAFQGQTTAEAYFVKCDSETTTQDDINNGIVNILIGFAPLKPAEFVIINIQQIAN